MPYRVTLILAALLGALMPLAFAPFSFWPITILVPAILFYLVDKDKPIKSLFMQGWFFGNGYFGFGVYWTYNSLHDFGQAPPLVAGLIAAALIMTLALFPAAVLCLWQRFKQQIGDRAIWLLPIIWFAFEWLRGWILTGMPWLSLGYAHAESPLAGFAPLIGVYGISALCILMSVACLRLVCHRQYSMSAIILLIPVVGFFLQSVDWTSPQGQALKVTLVQGNIPQEIKWRYEQRQNIFNTYWRETSQHWQSDLIVWPETALPGRSENIDESVLRPIAAAATEQGSHILTGIIVSEQAHNRFFNSMVLLGEQQGVYHKRHLVMFGEYYPLRSLLDFLRNWINIPYSDLTPGPDQQPLMSINGVKLGVSICFENVFSRDILRDFPDANILVNVSNDAWFGDSLAPHQHLQIAQMRALEFGRPMVRSTNTGISAYIDFRGKIIQRSEQFKTLSLSQKVQGRAGVTPFYYFARVQSILAGILLVLAFGFYISGRVKTK